MEENKNIQNEQAAETPATEAAEKTGFFANKKNVYIVAAIAAVAIVAGIVLAVVLGGNNAPVVDDNNGGEVGGDNDDDNDDSKDGEETDELAYANGIELLNKVWETIPDYDEENEMELKYSVDEDGNKFFYFYGGDMTVDEETYEPIVEYNQAGNVSLTEEMLYNLYYPMDMISSIDSAASLYSAMGNGIFTAAAFHVTDGKLLDIATKIEAGVQGEFWMCFMPWRVVLIEAPGDYVILVYGQDMVETFSNAVLSAIEGSKVLIDNPIER